MHGGSCGCSPMSCSAASSCALPRGICAPFVPSGRMLHGYLHYGTAGETGQLLEGTLTPNTLRFGSRRRRAGRCGRPQGS